MSKLSVLAAGVSAAVLCSSVYAAAPAKSGGTPPPPIANYWMDVSTSSGLGAGMMGGGRPNIGQMMAMMNGGGQSVAHTVNLRLSSRDKASGAPEANHFIPAGMQMGQSLPLLTPEPIKHEAKSGSDEPGSYEKPRGRMLIYWGCGEHAAEPMVIDFSKVAAGQIRPACRRSRKWGGQWAGCRCMNRRRRIPPGSANGRTFKDSRQVPASASLLGSHKSRAIIRRRSLSRSGRARISCPGLGLHETGAFRRAPYRLDWTPASQATGYALAIFGGNPNGDMIIWTSAKSASITPSFDYESPRRSGSWLLRALFCLRTRASACFPAEVAQRGSAGHGDAGRLRAGGLLLRCPQGAEVDRARVASRQPT